MAQKVTSSSAATEVGLIRVSKVEVKYSYSDKIAPYVL